MADVDTDQVWPPAGPIGQRALKVLLSRLGEAEQGGKNQGEIVRWACERWVSRKRYVELLPEGKLLWCAGAVCSAFEDAGSTAIREVGSLSCESLWARSADRLYTFDLLTPNLRPEEGDIVITRREVRQDGKVAYRWHASLLKEVDHDEQVLRVVAGNSGPKADRVAESALVLDERILGFIRIPG